MSTRPGPGPGTSAAWRMAVRLPTLPAAIAPVLVGTGAAIGREQFEALPAVAALAGAVCLQVGANLANDLFDFRKGTDTEDRLGPPRATQTGALSERQVLAGMAVVFGLATLAGAYLAVVAGWPVIAIGVTGIVAALAYTGGPWPFGYHALGDVFTFVFFGVAAVGGTYYVQSEHLPGLALAASLPMGCTVTAILVVNNLRDIPTDAATGKRTLAVLLGDRATRAWYVFLVAAAIPLAAATWLSGAAGPGVLLSVLALPAAFRPLRAVVSGVTGRPLNLALKETARFHLVFGALFACGLALS